VSTTRSDGELEDAKRRVEEVAEAIARGKFPAKPGYQCALCPYRNLCPETEKIVVVPEKKTSPRIN